MARETWLGGMGTIPEVVRTDGKHICMDLCAAVTPYTGVQGARPWTPICISGWGKKPYRPLSAKNARHHRRPPEPVPLLKGQPLSTERRCEQDQQVASKEAGLHLPSPHIPANPPTHAPRSRSPSRSRCRGEPESPPPAARVHPRMRG